MLMLDKCSEMASLCPRADNRPLIHVEIIVLHTIRIFEMSCVDSERIKTIVALCNTAESD